MIEENTKKQGLGFLPLFTDINVYHGLRMVATKRKQRMQSLITDILQNHYSVLMNGELNTNDPVVMHGQLIMANQSAGAESVFDYVEFCCVEFLNKEMDSLKPKQRDGNRIEKIVDKGNVLPFNPFNRQKDK
jgi:hypothetical protein